MRRPGPPSNYGSDPSPLEGSGGDRLDEIADLGLIDVSRHVCLAEDADKTVTVDHGQ